MSDREQTPPDQMEIEEIRSERAPKSQPHPPMSKGDSDVAENKMRYGSIFEQDTGQSFETVDHRQAQIG
jgi:hypothetical protein